MAAASHARGASAATASSLAGARSRRVAAAGETGPRQCAVPFCVAGLSEPRPQARAASSSLTRAYGALNREAGDAGQGGVHGVAPSVVVDSATSGAMTAPRCWMTIAATAFATVAAWTGTWPARRRRGMTRRKHRRTPSYRRPGRRARRGSIRRLHRSRAHARSGRSTEAPLGPTRCIRCMGTTSTRASSRSDGARAPSLCNEARVTVPAGRALHARLLLLVRSGRLGFGYGDARNQARLSHKGVRSVGARRAGRSRHRRRQLGTCLAVSLDRCLAASHERLMHRRAGCQRGAALIPTSAPRSVSQTRARHRPPRGGCPVGRSGGRDLGRGRRVLAVDPEGSSVGGG
jgi:hypothetical protein